MQSKQARRPQSWLQPISALFAVTAAFTLLGRPAQCAGNGLYVSPGGSDSSSGTSAAPLRQIRRAMQLAKPGDTVFVEDGSYLGFIIEDLNGTADAPITVKAMGKNVQVLPTTDRNDNRDNISVNTSSYLVFDGLNSSNAPRAGMRINTCNHITVRNGVFGNNGVWGIFTGHSDDLLLEKNECFGSKVQHGIYTSNSGDRPTIRFNRLHDNAGCGIHMNGDASEDGDGLISGAVIEGNVIYNNGLVGNAGSAINMDGVQDSVIRNNLLYNNHNRGIVGFQTDGAQGPKNLRILNNTVSMAQDGRWCIQLTETAGMNVVRNNLLYHPSKSLGGLLCGGDGDMANLDSDYNMLDRATPDGPAIPLGEWQALGKDAHSTVIGSKTLWVNAASGDFHLAAGSPAVDAGEMAPEVPQDLEQNPRPSGAAYDLGCYERQSGGSGPAAPTGLMGTSGDAQVELAWVASSSAGVSGYHVYVSAAPAPFTRADTTLIAGTSFTVTRLTNRKSYSFAVTAVNGQGAESPRSAVVQVTPEAPPARYTVSGRVAFQGKGISGITVTAGTHTAVTTTTGSYALRDLPAARYTVAASAPRYRFSAPRSITIGPNRSGVNLTATPLYDVDGRVVVNGAGVPGVTVKAGGVSAVTNSNGGFSFQGLPYGNQVLTAALRGYAFRPVKLNLKADQHNVVITGKQAH